VATHTYRYKLADPTLSRLAFEVPGTSVVGSLAPSLYLDITADSANKADLDDALTTRGYTFFSTDPVDTVSQAAASTAGSATPLTGLDREVRVASTANVASITGLLTIDGVTTVAGDRVLLKNQSTGSQNGVYIASASAWSYAPDWATNSVVAEAIVRSSEGTANLHKKWRLNTQGAIIVGTTSLSFVDDTGSSTDTDAIHKSVAAEISTITEKTTPVSADLLIIEDSAAANAKKRVQIGNLPSSGISATTHKTLLQLIHFIDEGPAEGFTTGATKTTTGTVFPTQNRWKRADATNLVDQNITWTGVTPTTIEWKVYDTDGSTVLATVTDTITYSGVFEASRSRSIA